MNALGMGKLLGQSHLLLFLLFFTVAFVGFILALGLASAYHSGGPPSTMGHSVEELDMSPIYVDTFNSFIGIGTPVPQEELEISAAADARILLRSTTEGLSYQSWLEFGSGSGAPASTNIVGEIGALITQADPSALKGELVFYTNRGDSSQEAMRIDDEGNVGIGTQSPDDDLHIRGTGTNRLTIEKTDAATGKWTQGISTAGSFFIRDMETGGSPIPFSIEKATPANTLYLDSGGYVGIGTIGPSARLTIPTPGDYDGDVMRFESKLEPNSYCMNLYTVVTSGVVRWVFDQRNAGTSYPSVLSFDRGNVGIGTVDPDGRLVTLEKGTLGSDTATNKANSGLRIIDAGDTLSLNFDSNQIESLGGPIYLNIGSANDIHMATGGGNVGIGTTDLSERLDVDGNLDMNNNYIKDASLFSGNAFRHQGQNILGAVYDKLIRADQKYTVTADKAIRSGAIGNLFDGHGGLSAIWYDADLPVAITINFSDKGMKHYWNGFALEFPYSRRVTGVKIEKYYDDNSDGDWDDCNSGDPSLLWATVYETATNDQDTILVRDNLGNGICQFRITLSGTPAYTNDIRIGEIGGWQWYYGQEGAFVRVTGDTIYGNLAVTGTITQDSWTAPTLLNGWVNYGGSWNPAGYFRDKNGIVHLRGLIRSSSATATTIFNLPAGYRPAYQELQMGQGYSGGYYDWRVDIDTSGNVISSRGIPADFLSIDGITFRASGY